MNDMRKLMESVAPLFEGIGAEDIAQQMARDGITYSPEREKEIIGLIGEYLMKNGETRRGARYYINYDEDYVPEVLGALPREGEQVMEDDYDDDSPELAALEELEDIYDQLERLSGVANDIMATYFPTELQELSAYGALNFGTSSNPYDTTFRKALDKLGREFHGEARPRG